MNRNLDKDSNRFNKYRDLLGQEVFCYVRNYAIGEGEVTRAVRKVTLDSITPAGNKATLSGRVTDDHRLRFAPLTDPEVAAVYEAEQNEKAAKSKEAEDRAAAEQARLAHLETIRVEIVAMIADVRTEDRLRLLVGLAKELRSWGL